MTTATLATPKAVETEPCLVFSGITWDEYMTISDMLGERAGLKIVYVDGSLTLLSPTYRHGLFSESCGDIVKAVADGLGIVWQQAGDTTYRKLSKSGGVEGDKAFYFGPNADRMSGEREIDLTTQPPPDLAVEVEVTHSADDAVVVWGRLGVPEVWRLDANRWTLTFGLRQDDGIYAPIPRSAALSPLEPADVLAQLERAEQLASSRWVQQLRDWVRDVLVPRRDAAGPQTGKADT